MPVRSDVVFHRALDNTRVHGDADGWKRLRCARAAASRRKSARRDRALCDDVDFAVAGTQRCLKQRAAAQTLRVADGGDRHIEAVALAHERLERCCHHDRRDVLEFERSRIDVHAVIDQHIRNGLDRLARARPIARPVKADNKAVAHDLVGAHALHLGDVLDPRHRRIRRRSPRQCGERERKEEQKDGIFLHKKRLPSEQNIEDLGEDALTLLGVQWSLPVESDSCIRHARRENRI